MFVEDLTGLQPGRWYYWGVSLRNRFGETGSVSPPARFMVDPALPPETAPAQAPGGVLLHDPLAGKPNPAPGSLKQARGWRAFTIESRPGAVQLDGKTGILVYGLDAFPEQDYSVRVRMMVQQKPGGRLGQVFSAWTRSMDDPLRLCLEGEKLYARLEAGRFYSAGGYPVELGRWYWVAAVKAGDRLRLYVDGKNAGETAVPWEVLSASREVALGGNPLFTGPEFLPVALSDFTFFGRALTPEETMAQR